MHKYEKRLTVKAEGEKASRVRLVMHKYKKDSLSKLKEKKRVG